MVKAHLRTILETILGCFTTDGQALRDTGTNHGGKRGAVRSVRTPLPAVAAPASSRDGDGATWVLPAVLTASLGAHALVLAAATFLPEPAPALASTHSEMAFDLVVPEPEPEPEPPPEPEVERPAAVVEQPRPRVRRPEPEVEPEVEPEPEPEAEPEVEPEPAPDPEPDREPVEAPPPPAEVLAARGEGTATWDHPPGEAGGTLGGTPGGEGTGPVGPVARAPAPAEAPRPGISRAELRRRLLDYMRSTLWSFVNGSIDHYPLAARRERLEGVVMLRIRLARDGRLLNVRLSRSSGHAMLDRAALASVERLESLPAPPRSIPWDDDRELPLPITYRLDR